MTAPVTTTERGEGEGGETRRRKQAQVWFARGDTNPFGEPPPSLWFFVFVGFWRKSFQKSLKIVKKMKSLKKKQKNKKQKNKKTKTKKQTNKQKQKQKKTEINWYR